METSVWDFGSQRSDVQGGGAIVMTFLLSVHVRTYIEGIWNLHLANIH